jgi:Domain of unknown function (DUF362)
MIGDGPQSDSKFTEVSRLMGLSEIQNFYSRFPRFEVEIVNLQYEHHIERDGIYVATVNLQGDPKGGVEFDISNNSMFSELDAAGKKYYGAYYDIEETNGHHHAGKHEYMIARSPVAADVFINIPKLKTHKKCGLTVNLKSLVGINANKNWLPHYAIGSPHDNGDQFPTHTGKTRLENGVVLWAKKILKKERPGFQFVARKTKKLAYKIFGGTEQVVRSGNWHGNDTVWRMCLDLNRILMYGAPDGTLDPSRKRKRFLSLVDGIAAMEGDGPVSGTRKEAGLIIAGDDAVAVDAACARLMGFDYQRIPIIMRAFEPHAMPLTDLDYDHIELVSNLRDLCGLLRNFPEEHSLHFKPHFGWVGHIEVETKPK